MIQHTINALDSLPWWGWGLSGLGIAAVVLFFMFLSAYAEAWTR